MKLMLTTLISVFLFSSSLLVDGHSQANSFGFALKVPEAEIANVEALLASHREFMENTHSVSGDKDVRLNSYAVIKGPEFKNPMDPSQGTIGMFYILAEHYETPNGLKHIEAGSKWKDIDKFQETMVKFAVGVVYPGQLVSKMNR